ncbi:MAG: hypothetical protein N2445_01070 [Acidobacteria bacterium]|nr:hypothetical protein [Acidobacteriota bacterium]
MKIFYRNILFFIIIVFVSFFFYVDTYDFGPPNWAEPYASKFCPLDAKILSKNDEWATIYSEIEFSISQEGYLIKTERSLIENISSSEKEFTGTVLFDQHRQELLEVELKIQSKYRWRKIKIAEYAGKIVNSHGGSVFFVSSELIPSHNKIAWEYSIVDRTKIISWNYEYILSIFPILEKKVMISNSAKNAGYTLELVDNFSFEPANDIIRVSDDTYLIKNIPSIKNIISNDSELFYLDCIYPYFIFSNKNKEEEINSFSKKYLEKWELTVTEEAKKYISEVAKELIKYKSELIDKIETIADFVQYQINYDANYEKGDFNLLPLSPVEVLRSKRADCKGKVLLAQKLLESIGVKSEIILLRYYGVFYPFNKLEICKAHLNHVVLAIDCKSLKDYDAEIISGPAKGLILFDPTNKTSRFGKSPPGVEGMTGFMPLYPQSGLFQVSLKKASPWAFEAKAIFDYDEKRNLKVDLQVVDNGLSLLPSIFDKNLSEEEMSSELKSLYSETSTSIKVLDVKIFKPPVADHWEANIKLKVERPFFELNQSTLYVNPLAFALPGVPIFQQNRNLSSNYEQLELYPPWNRKSNSNGFQEKIILDLKINFPQMPYFSLPKNTLIDDPWLKSVIEWRIVDDNDYSAKINIVFQRGQWDPQLFDQRKKDISTLKQNLFSPFKGK